MEFINAGFITVEPGRMRQEFDPEAHNELAESIRTKGLFHPIGLRRVDEGPLVLIYGERRLRAMMALHEAQIPFTCGGETVPTGNVPFLAVTPSLTSIDLLEVELEENVKRKDLTWQEMVAARAKLFKLRQGQAAERGESFTTTKLADELRRAGAAETTVQHVARQLAVARFMDTPEVSGAKTFKEAQVAAKKAVENTIISALDDAILAEGFQTKHTLIEGDALIELSKQEANTYDCVLTDPPYGIGIDNAGSMVASAHHYSDGADILEEILERVPLQLYRITRQQAHVYWFCDLSKLHLISHALEIAGFQVCPRPIIWWKRGKAMAPDVTRWPKHEYECIVFAIKGDRPPLKVAGDVISTSYSSDLQQAEKPRDLFVELLSRSVLAGSKVIDPFCGSGVIFDAAEALGSSAVGIELDAERASLARIRATGEL